MSQVRVSGVARRCTAVTRRFLNRSVLHASTRSGSWNRMLLLPISRRSSVVDLVLTHAHSGTQLHICTPHEQTRCVFMHVRWKREREKSRVAAHTHTHTLENTRMYVFVSWHRIAATELAPPWACRSVTHHGLQRKCKCKRRSVCVSVCVCECGPPRPCLPSAPVAVDTHLTKKWLLIVIL